METRLVKINNMEDCKKDMEEAGELTKQANLLHFQQRQSMVLEGMDYFLMRQRRSMQRKEGPSDNPLILHVCDMQMVESLVKEIPRQCKTCDGTFLAGTYDGDLAESGSGTRLCDRRT